VAQAGARSASYILLRLPQTVKPVFLDWVARCLPEKQAVIESGLRAVRNGNLNDSNFGTRMSGTGLLADQIQRSFRVFSRRYGLEGRAASLATDQFRPPRSTSGQMSLF